MDIRTSIIIISYNCKNLLLQTLDSVHRTVTNDVEVIVVENGTDGGVEHAVTKFPRIRVIQNERNTGFAGGNNLGFRHAKGKFILLLNPDTIVLPETVESLVAFMEANPQCGVCGPRIRDMKGARVCNPCAAVSPARMLRQTVGGRILRLAGPSAGLQQRTTKCDFVHGSCMMIRREVYERLGGLDEGLFMYCEEFEFCSRATQAGWETWFVAGAEVIHIGEGATKSSLAWVLPLRTHSALAAYGRQRGVAWMAAFRGALALDTLVSVGGSLVSLRTETGRAQFRSRLQGLSLTLAVLALPVDVGIRLIPIPRQQKSHVA